MTPELWRAVRPLLESALELEPQQRPAWLDRACADAGVRREVESLLASHDRAAPGVLNSALALAPGPEDQASMRMLVGKRVGAYRILSEIAVGGMGAVYRATRDDGQYRQDVALKIVRPELGSYFTSDRFRIERQILASLDHPNIARMFDGGVTDEGVPYYVMELIDGQSITEYCDRQRLTVRERIEIFLAVCAAVHYSHQHLVVHRDIKPANILVTTAGIPKLLDFGIAKLLDAEGASRPAGLTVAGWLMTPDYASPEQFAGGQVTTATDVYSLGLVLYELLTGKRAHEIAGQTPRQIALTVAERDPERPSTAVSRQDAGPQRASTPHRLRRALRGDLDNIVMKALRKEPAKRYETVDRLADDLRRHLRSEPVLARRNTARYQLGRFLARHKMAMGAAAAIAITLIGGLIVTLHEARVARANEQRAERRFDEVRSLARSLVFEIDDSIRQVPGSTRARQLLVQRAREYLERLSTEAGGNPDLQRELAGTYEKLAEIQGDFTTANVGDSAGALQSFRRAAALLESAAAARPTDPAVRRELAQSYLLLARALSQSGKPGENAACIDRAESLLRGMAGPAPDDKLQFLLAKTHELTARRLSKEKDFGGALDHYGKAAALYGRLHDANPADATYLTEVSFSHKHIGAVLAVRQELAAAMAHYQQARAIDEGRLVSDPQNLDYRYAVTFDYSDIGYILARQGSVDEALAYYRKSLDIREALAAADPSDARAKRGIASAWSAIGTTLSRKKDYPAALDAYQRSRAMREELVKLDSGNALLRFDVAAAELHVAEAYADMAANSAPGTASRFCSESLKWNRRARASWPPANAVDGAKPPELDPMTENISRCHLEQARASAGAGAT